MITSNRVQLEDTATLGHFDRIIQVDTIGDLNELDTEGARRASGPRTSRKKATRCVSSSSVAPTSSFRRRTVIVARPAARELRTQLRLVRTVVM
jgi:hypothetical protein